MQAKVYATKGAANTAIGQVNATLGYPRTEVGVRVGGGRHVASITTTTCAAPVELKDGTFAVDVEQLRKRFAVAEKDVLDVTLDLVKESIP